MDQVRDGILQTRYLAVLERMGKAAKRAGRSLEEVTLVVVTKGHPYETVRAAITVGAKVFGENYATEGAQKIEQLQGYSGLSWHMIGHIQSRKARLVCETYDFIHTIDSLKLARRIDQACASLGRKIPALLECNVSGESTKYGFPFWGEAQTEQNLEIIGQIASMEHIELRGLMTMAPFSVDPEAARPFFQKLRRLRAHLAIRFPRVNWKDLSMGMSGDFEVAIEEGATLVRIGTAILGPRQQRKH